MFRYLPKIVVTRHFYSNVSRLSTKSSPLPSLSATTSSPSHLSTQFTGDRPSLTLPEDCVKQLKQTSEDGQPFTLKIRGDESEKIRCNLELVDGQDEVKLEWRPLEDPNGLKSINYYLKLSKFRLTSLVVLTTLAGYTMGCSSFDPIVASASLIGTGLTSAAAASLNQFLEIPFDSQMMRTRNRPLVLGQLSSGRAFSFSIISGTIGLTTLATFVNPLTAALGAFNLVLYSFVYTPMKRANIANTWVGSIVGAIPPVMGYTAATNMIDLPSILLGLILYSWQFPHFNALSWNIRHDYARAGYRMMSVTNEQLCVRTALRHAYLLTAYSCSMSAPFVGLTNYAFLAGSLPLNIYLIYLSYKFYQTPNATTSRKLFRYSLIHLPALIILMLITKSTKSQQQQQIITSTEKLT
ncbi:protoheme IX farnesyltransferase, mitochondrial-like [Panonychus citri]|uniref:protoheme IX farnesyltransferase, mitochondrial-like n=1 Tax=Panonychus citri TaxID=50023 RepID=UPI0023071C48|nr:protoheme IX farnesyltransferase, mitochondrial-like [Panonychus citri]